ncbi:hypothetical protein ANN_24044 [Periplaneta americana]|uniref:Mos1 transposase HTH domain-containing protein n=1 Tax=Periplaneta americana TaxID=6978 RepID=A0ABQ8S2F7_PERAM|nr:hypothetical protein ANN_24044 [Periplaneta americana]
MAGLCEGGNEPPGSLKARGKQNVKQIQNTEDEGLGKQLEVPEGRSMDKTNGGNAREDMIRTSEGMKRLPDISDCEDRIDRALERLLVKKKSAEKQTVQCERPKIMFTKLEQRSWIKIEVARGRSAQECFQGLREACGDAALPYHIVARWVKAFREGLVGSAVKVMFIVAYDIDGVILHHAVPPRQTVNADYYCRFLQHYLRPALRRKRRHLGAQNPIILHDNAKSHTAAAVKDLVSLAMGDSGTSSVLTRYDPCDYDLFTKVKEPLRGTRYNTRDELIRALGRSIRNINKDGRADGVRRLPNICQKDHNGRPRGPQLVRGP